MCQTATLPETTQPKVGDGFANWIFGNDYSREQLMSGGGAGLVLTVLTKRGWVTTGYIVSRCETGWKLTKENADGSFGESHVVDTTFDADPGLWQCDCKDALYRNRSACKHVKGLRNALRKIGIIQF